MGFFGRMLGIEDEAERARSRVAPPRGAGGEPEGDAQAIERYRYMLRTAPPETLEQAHAEAFAKLTPEQRRRVLAELTAAAPPAEQANVAATSVDDPNALARVATRTEIRQPGTLERALGGGAMGFGGGLLSSFAMGFVGSMVAQSFFSALGGMSFGGDEASADNADANEGDAVAENDVEDNGDYADDGFDGGGDFDV
jgi:hypothetical protein